MLFSLAMFPVGGGDSLVGPVSEVVEEIDRSGLQYEVTGMDTVIEGEWDDVMPVIRRAEQRLREKHDRVYMLLAVDDHEGSTNRLNEAVRDVERRLGKPVSR
ncbi:MAG TPA: MTH1187 family thiamine-binding protein [Longimicrobiales bacterium]